MHDYSGFLKLEVQEWIEWDPYMSCDKSQVIEAETLA